MLLTSLLDSYDNIVIAILYKEDTLKMEEVESTLLSNDKRKTSNEESSNLAMIIHDHNKGRSASQGSGESSRPRSMLQVQATGSLSWYCHLNHNNASIACAKKENFGNVLTVLKVILFLKVIEYWTRDIRVIFAL